jgi:hypothetical protein
VPRVWPRDPRGSSRSAPAYCWIFPACFSRNRSAFRLLPWSRHSNFARGLPVIGQTAEHRRKRCFWIPRVNDVQQLPYCASRLEIRVYQNQSSPDSTAQRHAQVYSHATFQRHERPTHGVDPFRLSSLAANRCPHSSAQGAHPPPCPARSPPRPPRASLQTPETPRSPRSTPCS